LSRIGICHFRVGLIDGVSLEIEKWKNALEKIGHAVYLLAGEAPNIGATIIPKLRLDHPEINKIYNNSFHFLNDFPSEEALCQEIYKIANQIEEKIYSFIRKFSIDLLDVENVWSLPLNIPAAIALFRVIKSTGIKAICHHHDFFWERSHFDHPTCKAIKEILVTYFPPKNILITHTVINTLARDELKKRRGIPSVVIPNIFDFEGPEWKIDDYNDDFKEALGLSPKDMIILQATRVISRKGIELAIDLVKELAQPDNLLLLKEKRFYDKREIDEKSKVVLVLPNLIEDMEYFKLLKEKIKKKNIDALFIGDIVDTIRKMENNRKIYSLWDTYLFADLVTYPSLYEGWGNQFLEAIKARLPIVVFEYEVYKRDIKPNGFRVISLGDKLKGKDVQGLCKIDSSIIKGAASEAIRVLTDLPYREKMVEHNFNLGRRLYSTPALRKYLEPLFGK
jgi:glycosyltransferase involved in cell wall biosynthesis